jgi:hypothetical protein
MNRSSVCRRPLWLTLAILITIVSSSTHAQISVTGIADKGVYTDRVAFTVPAQAGFAYDVRLDNTPVPVGVANTVDAVDYHELSVWQTNLANGSFTNLLLRFIVFSSQRGSTEHGLPPWTPYPPIPSAAAEAAGAHLRLIAPAAYPAGWEIPVIAWVENETGGAVRINGALTASGQPPISIRRGVGSGFLSSTNDPGPVVYRGQLLQMTGERIIALETNPTWTAVSGQLTGNVTWPEDSRIAVTGHLTLSGGASLTVGAGTIIQVGPSNNIAVAGRLVVNGTADRPVVFTPLNRAQPWGGFYLTNSTSDLAATYTIFTGSGAHPNGVPESHRHEQGLFFCDNHSKLSLTNCAAINLNGQLGHGTDRGQPLNEINIVRTLIQRCTTGGEWNGCDIKFLQSALIEVPYETPVFNDGDEDGIYFTTGRYEVRDSLIGWTRDDGIDAGSGGASSVTVSNTWIESTYHEAFAWSGGDRMGTNDHTVSINCGQGIECGWSSTANSPNVFVTDSLSTANLSGLRFGDNYDWTYNGFLRVTNSLVLHNYRDVYGRNWDDWEYRTNALDIQGNFLTASDPLQPNNTVWNPDRDGSRLVAFMTTPPDADVGIGLALYEGQRPIAAISNRVPVRLSSFTTHHVSVNYTFEAPSRLIAQGTVEFAPGETVKFISLESALPAGSDPVRLRLRDAQRGQVTGQPELWYMPAGGSASTVLIPAGATWKYLDTGTNAGTAWRELGFDDSAWPSGAAELGYGDAKDGRPETTVIRYGPSETSKYITYYFRHSFAVTNPAAWSGLQVHLKRDDGGIVYLNGTNVFTSNLPNSGVDYLTRATLASDDGASFFTTNAPATLLVAGTNTVAVEIHQESAGSSDLSFDLKLEAAPGLTLQSAQFGPDWVLYWSGSGTVLEQGESLEGPWSTAAQSSPYLVTPSEPLKFFRLRQP